MKWGVPARVKVVWGVANHQTILSLFYGASHTKGGRMGCLGQDQARQEPCLTHMPDPSTIPGSSVCRSYVIGFRLNSLPAHPCSQGCLSAPSLGLCVRWSAQVVDLQSRCVGEHCPRLTGCDKQQRAVGCCTAVVEASQGWRSKSGRPV